MVAGSSPVIPTQKPRTAIAVRGFLMPSPELAQRRNGIKTHRPERSSVAGFLSQGSPQRTRQSFCAAKRLATKNF